jgi:hypothetical protein
MANEWRMANGCRMANQSTLSSEFAFACAVERFYAALMMFATIDAGASQEPALGGQLLYAGELDGESRILVAAGNVAGAATLTATADQAMQKQATRDGVVDFLVTNLDEALRILKNEIRKRETVAVCVGQASADVESEMRERGIVPDLVAGRLPGDTNNHAGFAASAKQIEPEAVRDNQSLLAWSVASAPARWMPKLDALALECTDDGEARRWLRLAPRYLGRLARGTRVLRCEPDTVQEFIARVDLAVMRGEIGVQVEIEVTRRGIVDRHRFSPDLSPRTTS